ncbi:MAG: 3-phosphoshikimate 1-carboxyvinyltransferase [Gammaproteobacteria bacterium]|nr:MAG: 3-phosphoshikimate 1-carboxyvinyltransferase [Gammaproteobacteria bacterium]
MISYFISPGGKLSGKFRVPGDKSISHRALMLAAIADGQSRITGFLDSEDTLVTMAAFKAMGVEIQRTSENEVLVNGVGKSGLSAPGEVLNLGNSGTSVRLLSGLLAGLGIECELTGDQSLMSRPMRRIIDPLQKMHALITCSEDDTLPIHIKGGACLTAIDFEMPVASAQLKSSLLLAGLSAKGRTRIHEPVATRDHTERMLTQFAYQVECVKNTISLEGGGTLRGTTIEVPADISSAAFYIVGACIAEDSDIIIENVGINPNRDAIIHILREMGADITLLNEKVVSGEPIADIQVRTSVLHGIDIPESRVPAAIDELPVIMVAAACAKGVTRLTGARELRVKESDRITAMSEGLQTLGIEVEEQEAGMTVTGGAIAGGEINSFTDHRIAMAFTIAGLNAKAPITVKDCANVETSFPGFVDIAKNVGLDLLVQEQA